MKLIKFIDNFYFVSPAVNPLKKYDVYDKNGTFINSFGGIRKNGTPYQQYFDKIGKFKQFNHHDKIRKINYYKRHGRSTKRYSPKYFSHKYLW